MWSLEIGKGSRLERESDTLWDKECEPTIWCFSNQNIVPGPESHREDITKGHLMKRILRERISCSSFVLRVNPTALTKCVNEDSQFSLGTLLSIFHFKNTLKGA